MAINKKQLKKQLEDTAAQLVSQSDDVDLASHILMVCSRLLASADKIIPEKLEDDQFETLFSTYLGISGRVKQFYSSNQQPLNKIESSLIETKNKISKEIESIETDIAKLKSDKADLEKKKAEMQTKKTKLEDEKKNVEKEYNKIKAQHDELSRELTDKRNQIESFEKDIKTFTAEMEKANAEYSDLIAYYEEVGRISEGVKNEGYASIESFNEHLIDTNKQAETLMSDYDRILKNLSADVKALQVRIETLRKA